MDIEAKIVKTFPASSKLRAVVNITIGGCFVVHGVKIFDSVNGQFVSMPGVKVGDYYVDTFHAITKEARTRLMDTVMGSWQQYQLSQPVQQTARAQPEDAEPEPRMAI